MPQRPSSRLCQVSAALWPIAVIRPMPVTITRRRCSLMPRPPGRLVADQGQDAGGGDHPAAGPGGGPALGAVRAVSGHLDGEVDLVAGADEVLEAHAAHGGQAPGAGARGGTGERGHALQQQHTGQDGVAREVVGEAGQGGGHVAHGRRPLADDGLQQPVEAGPPPGTAAATGPA